ncbi:MAG: hypothetical protein KBA66_05335 [Leptospiraceae bacterium]|nr:hypothetical protein [Leptospiraceae bacterium]
MLFLDRMKGLGLKFSFLFFITLIFYSNSIFSETETTPTHKYEDCKFHAVKSKGKLDCIVEEFSGNEMYLFVYELNNQSLSGTPEKIIIPSWYNFANVEYADILGEEKKMIFVTFEGKTGEAALQKILLVFHFQNNSFRPVLMETLSHTQSCCGKAQSLDIKYKFLDAGTKRVSIQFDYTYNQYVKSKIQLDKRKTWSDELVWDNKNLTFYDSEQEQKKNKRANFYVEKKIYETRLEFPPIHKIEMNKLNELIFKSKIFEVLVDEKS